MTEIVDLTFTDSDTEAQPAPATQIPDEDDSLCVPLRHRLQALQNGAPLDLPFAEEVDDPPPTQPAPLQPSSQEEVIEILDSPERPHPSPGQKRRFQEVERKTQQSSPPPAASSWQHRQPQEEALEIETEADKKEKKEEEEVVLLSVSSPSKRRKQTSYDDEFDDGNDDDDDDELPAWLKDKPPLRPATTTTLPPPLPRPLPAALPPLPYDDDHEDIGACTTQSQPQPQSQSQAAAEGEHGRGRKPKRTREEAARDAALKKQQKAVDTAARKAVQQYNSDRHVLRFLTTVMDPALMGSTLGLKIAEAFQETRAQQAEHEHLHYSVAPTGIPTYKTVKWRRKVPHQAAAAAVGGVGADVLYNNGGGGGALRASGSQQLPSIHEHCATNTLFNIGEGINTINTIPTEVLIEREELHVLVCFDAEEFVTAVQLDGLSSMFSTLHQHCPTYRPHLLVLRLDQFLTKKERQDYGRAIQGKTTTTTTSTATAATSAAGDGSVFNRRSIDEFVARLTVEAPLVGFRDVSTAEEGANHVCSLTKAIARRFIDKDDASKYLSGQSRNKKSATSVATVLANNPVGNVSTEAFLSSLCAMPSVGPQVAHAVAMKYGSLGALMEMLFDPGRSSAEKIREIEFLPRIGSGRVQKVGPKAAKQLMELLTGEDPDIAVHPDG